VHGDGEQALDYVYVDDCVEALLALAQPGRDGLTCNVSTGRATTVNELTRLLLTASRSELEPVSGPSDWTAGTIRAGSPELARGVLGGRASTPLADGLARIWSWLESEHAPRPVPSRA